MKKIFALLLAIMILMTGCASSKDEPPEKNETVLSENAEAITKEKTTTDETATRIITDVRGREVEIPTEIDSIICTGPNALRLVCYAEAQDLLIGVEDCEKSHGNGNKADSLESNYTFTNFEKFQELPSIGKGCNCGYSAYPEEIIKLQPDIIISTITPDGIEELTKKVGVPVVCVSDSMDFFNYDSMMNALTLIGDVIGREGRCNELVSYLEEIKNDLNDRTKDIPDENKMKIYVGAIMYGQGLEGTQAGFGPLKAINGINVADEVKEKGGKGSFDVDFEKIINWNPDVIFVDSANLSIVNDEYAKKPDLFNSIPAIRDGNIHSLICYCYYGANYAPALANAYYMGTVLFPEQFEDIDIAEKTDEICEMLLDNVHYLDFQAKGWSFGEVTIGE